MAYFYKSNIYEIKYLFTFYDESLVSLPVLKLALLAIQNLFFEADLCSLFPEDL